MSKTPYHIDTFINLLHCAEKQEVIVPNFQRRFEWSRDKQTSLAASCLCQLPIGAMVLFDADREAFDHRLLCENESRRSSRHQVRYLLDGQQRLSTLTSVFADLFRDWPNWKTTLKSLYPPLQNRWVLKLQDDESERTLFGLDNSKPSLDQSEAATLPDEPSDLRTHLVPYRIMVNEGESKDPPWWHPAYQAAMLADGKSHYEIQAEVAKNAAREQVIPLWELALSDDLKSDQKKPIHLYAAQRISQMVELTLRDYIQQDVRDERVLNMAEPTDPGVRHRIVTKDAMVNLMMMSAAEWASIVSNSLERVVKLQIPTITVESNDLRRAVTIFENINEGGTPLSAFDLVNAKAVPGNETAPPLRDRVHSSLSGQLHVSHEMKATIPCVYDKVDGSVLTSVINGEMPAIVRNQYLNLLSIVGHKGTKPLSDNLPIEFIKRQKQLQLNSTQINGSTDLVCTALSRAFFFLHFRCGIRSPGSLSYALMCLPVAFCFVDDDLFIDPNTWNKIEFWYWTSLFGGRYRARQNDICVTDIKALRNWCIEGGDFPFISARGRVLNEPRYSDRESFLPKDGPAEVSKAVSDGILQFVLSQSPHDLLPKAWSAVRLTAYDAAAKTTVHTRRADGSTEAFRLELQDHHIVPLVSVVRISESAIELRKNRTSLYNSPLNKTPISSHANALIRGKSPLAYFNEIADDTLRMHLITQSATDVWELIQDDTPLDGNPNERGIREVLDGRFTEARARIGQRLNQLEHGF